MDTQNTRQTRRNWITVTLWIVAGIVATYVVGMMLLALFLTVALQGI